MQFDFSLQTIIFVLNWIILLIIININVRCWYTLQCNEYRIQVDKANKDGFQKMITDTKEALKIQEDNTNL